MADLKAKRGYVQDELGTSCYARKEALEKKKVMMGHGTRTEKPDEGRAPWSNLGQSEYQNN